MGSWEWNLAHPSKVSKYIIPDLLSHLRPKEFMTIMMTPTNPCFLCRKILNENEDSCRNIQQEPSDPVKKSNAEFNVLCFNPPVLLQASTSCCISLSKPTMKSTIRRSISTWKYLSKRSFCLVPKPGESGVSLATCAHTCKIFSNMFSRLCFSCRIPDLIQHSSNVDYHN